MTDKTTGIFQTGDLVQFQQGSKPTLVLEAHNTIVNTNVALPGWCLHLLFGNNDYDGDYNGFSRSVILEYTFLEGAKIQRGQETLEYRVPEEYRYLIDENS